MGGWSVDSGFSAISNATLSTTEVHGGTDSVALTLEMAGSQAMFDNKSFGGTTDISGKTFTAWVWIPTAITSSTYALELFVQGDLSATDTNWGDTENNWDVANASGFTANAWNKITWTIPTTYGTQHAQAIGFNIQQAGGTTMTSPTTLYLDDVTIQ
jgi:hypothetical protein